VPDIVCMSKSLSGYGLPMAITLLRRELDVWDPGEHNGTFRGFNPAFVTATAALVDFWTEDGLEKETLAKGEQVETALKQIAAEHGDAGTDIRGRGLARGIAFEDYALAGKVCAAAYERNLLMETSGPEGEVVKLLPPLTASRQELAEGLEILGESVIAARELQPA